MPGTKPVPGPILFVVNGLGLGNSTRCFAVIEQLRNQGVEVEVATSGNGLNFFSTHFDPGRVHALFGMGYGKSAQGRLSLLRTFGKLPWFGLGGLWNSLKLARLIWALSPAVIVTDSSYNLVIFLLGRRTVSINNADMVMQLARKADAMPRLARLHLVGIECLDALFHRFLPDLVFSPWFQKPQTKENLPHHIVGLLVRREFRETPVAPEASRPLGRVAIMLSGSQLAAIVVPQEWGLSYQFEVIGRDGQSTDRVHYHGKVLNPCPLLKRADLVVVNGGYSGIAELLVLRKPLLVIPIEGHGEQYVNASVVKDLGVGDFSSLEELPRKIQQMGEKLDTYRRRYQELNLNVQGARQVAEKLLAGI